MSQTAQTLQDIIAASLEKGLGLRAIAAQDLAEAILRNAAELGVDVTEHCAPIDPPRRTAMKSVIEIFTAALHEEGGIPESDAFRIARKLLPDRSHDLVLAGSNEWVRARIVAEYNGRNVNDLSKKYGRHRATIYRIVRRNEPDAEQSTAQLQESGIDKFLCRINR